jgi:hypothetical protein
MTNLGLKKLDENNKHQAVTSGVERFESKGMGSSLCVTIARGKQRAA